MRISRPLLSLLLAGMALTAQAQSLKPLRIGFICPFTGGSADFGTSARLGAQLAVKEINEVGGYMGRPVELLARDDRSQPDEGRKAAEDLILKEKVDFTIGFCNTGVALKSLDLFQTHKHLLVVPVATGTAITTQYPADKSYIFRMSARDSLQAAFLVEDIVRRDIRRVAVFADTSGYGEGGLKDIERLLAEKQLKPVHVARFDAGVADLTQEVQAAKAAGAEAIVGYTVAPGFVALAQARAQARFSGALYGPWTLSLRTVGEKAGAAAEGAMMVQTFIADPEGANEGRTSFIARLKRQAGTGGIGSLMAAAQTYDAVQLMLRVMFQTKGDASADALKRALENLERPYTGVVTTHEKPFSARDHDAFSRNMIWLGVWRKGEIQFRDPEDAKRSSFIRRKE